MSLHEHLHDAIDIREEFAERARIAAVGVLKARFAEALDATESFDEALTLIVSWISRELDEITSEAARAGARHVARRGKRGKGEAKAAAKEGSE